MADLFRSLALACRGTARIASAMGVSRESKGLTQIRKGDATHCADGEVYPLLATPSISNRFIPKPSSRRGRGSEALRESMHWAGRTSFSAWTAYSSTSRACSAIGFVAYSPATMSSQVIVRPRCCTTTSPAVRRSCAKAFSWTFSKFQRPAHRERQTHRRWQVAGYRSDCFHRLALAISPSLSALGPSFAMAPPEGHRRINACRATRRPDLTAMAVSQ